MTEEVVTDYTPTFSAAERKIAYLVSGMAGIIGGVVTIASSMPGCPAWVTVMGGALAVIGSGVAGMFGVHYAGISK